MRIRSFVLSLIAVALLAVSGIGTVAAQDATPATGDSGSPELTMTLTDTGIEGLPAETPAGWTTVTFTNSATPTGDPFEDAWGIDFIMLPDGMTVDDVAAAFAGPPPGAEGEGEGDMEGMDMASPESMEGMDMGSPEAGAAPEDPFAFLYDTYLAGGPGALSGETTQATIYLEPGTYAVLALGFSPPVELTVTGTADPAAPAPVTADATITEAGTSGSFDFSGTLPEGQGVIEIYNDSDQPHFVEAIYSPNPITEDEVLELLMMEEGATPAAGGPDFSQLSVAFITGTQSAETTQYITADLQPGYYVLLCFVPDPQQEGIPHAFAGMIEVIETGAGATPAA
jgi:hypothetical protein